MEGSRVKFLKANTNFALDLIWEVLQVLPKDKNFVFQPIGVGTHIAGLHNVANEELKQIIELLLELEDPNSDEETGGSNLDAEEGEVDDDSEYETEEEEEEGEEEDVEGEDDDKNDYDDDGSEQEESDEVVKTLKEVNTFKLRKKIPLFGRKIPSPTNKMYVDCTYSPDVTFLKEMKKYRISAKVVDFQTQKPLQKIQRLMKDELKPLLNLRNKMVLINRGSTRKTWLRRFNLEIRPFQEDHLDYKQVYRAPFLTVTSPFRIRRIPELRATVCQLPYSCKKQSMYILLPDNVNGLQKLEDRLLADDVLDQWPSMVKSLQRHLVRVSIPKFKFISSIDLKPILKNLGLQMLFDGDSFALSGLSNQKDFCVSEYFQLNRGGIMIEGKLNSPSATQCSQMANKEGTKSAIPFIANHPFLFIIQDDKTGTILSIGRVCRLDKKYLSTKVAALVLKGIKIIV